MAILMADHNVHRSVQLKKYSILKSLILLHSHCGDHNEPPTTLDVQGLPPGVSQGNPPNSPKEIHRNLHGNPVSPGAQETGGPLEKQCQQCPSVNTIELKRILDITEKSQNVFVFLST